MTNIILCGGSGTRLWPISRTLMPKQFVKLFSQENTQKQNNQSLFQLTVQRNSNLYNQQLIVSNSEQYFLALDQLEELHQTNTQYILEPIGRNTAPAIALACMALNKEEVVLVTPSDHLIKNENTYNKVLQQAKELALKSNLVTFGITPTYAETGYGYIEAKEYDVKAFHEKPNSTNAKKYLEAGNYYWNSGMFCFKAGVFLKELKKHSPRIYEASLQAFHNAKQDGMIRIQHEDMLNIPEDSIDYAVMEKSNKVKVVPSNIGWSDIGSFDALYEELEKDRDGNTLNKNHISIDSENNLIHSKDKKVATIDIEDMIIVDTDDALLVTKKGSSQKVKDIVSKLKEEENELHYIHTTGYRPWGSYTILEEDVGYKIKHIEVKPNHRLSLQKHYHRNEHWIVLSGIATVTVNEKTFDVLSNESTYIKAGDIHRLENRGKSPLIIIEVQVGEYTGEDDIVRIEDDYERL